MTKTTTDLAEAVLKRLGVLAAGDTASAEDANDVKDYYADEFETLQTRDIAFWDQATIPVSVFRPLTDYIAGKMAPDFGQARPDLQESGYRELLILASDPGMGGDVTGGYF